jgi:hypothetical protein
MYVNSLCQNRWFHSSDNCIYLWLRFSDKMYSFLPSSLCFMSSNLITRLLGRLNATLKKCQDWDILNLMRNQGNIKNELLNLFRNVSRVCLHAPILCYYLWSHWCFQEPYEMNLFEKLLFLDSIALSANIEILVADENTCEELVETKGPGA